MQVLGLNELREKYLSFFESKDHLRRESFSLIPEGDPTLLLIGAGMAPMKAYFSGEAVPPAPRMTTCQKCVRVIDIDRVGLTDRHCTFFEMLGHFSFGDYFKREAIAWTWEFFTKTLGIDPELLYCSVYLDDDEAWDIWTKEVGVDPSHMARMGKEDNFWDIGSGPCGPSSEIYYDRGPEHGCGKADCKVGCDCDRFVEIGNNVFTQFNNNGAGEYTPLSQKNIDFGMGLERLACIVQGAESVFEVDTITRIRQHMSRIAGVDYKVNEKNDVSLRIITDHIRSSVMLICDGVQPSNEGRGYVLRRILRRAARHGRLLGVETPFLHELANTVITESQNAYPELGVKREYIHNVVSIEEERFAGTLDAGMRLLRNEMENQKDGVFPGETAFKLYDTFGFPVDLTAEILAEHQVTLDRQSFDACMQAQRERARNARNAMGNQGWAKLELPKAMTTAFTGYQTMEDTGKIIYILADGEGRDTAHEGQNVTLVLDQSPFYAESGGQTADLGILAGPTGRMEVRDVKKSADGAILHMGELLSGELAVGQTVTCTVDRTHREAVARAHTATHLLQKALREVLGEHITQAGSLVEADKLRFDFTHNAALTKQEREAVQNLVNRYIMEGHPVSTEEMSVDKAKKKGALALFGEKYGATVRVVSMGDISMELCGGTHLPNTAMAGTFILRSDSSVAAGTRRMEAIVGRMVPTVWKNTEGIVEELSALLKTPPAELQARVASLLEEQKTLQRTLEKQKQSDGDNKAAAALATAKDVGGLHVLSWKPDDTDTNGLRLLGDSLRSKDPLVAAVLALTQEEKLTFLAVCGTEAVKRGVKAGALIAAVTKICGGSGGGRPDSAMGGGKDASKLDEALSKVEELVDGMMK